MPIFPSVASCIALVLCFPVLYRSAKAVSPSREKAPGIPSNSNPSDPCTHVNDWSNDEQKAVADKICAQAFLALDENHANSCRGWRHPSCRLLPGSPTRQCSCMISMCNQSGITTDETKSFRECASDLRPDWYFTEQAAQSSGFQELLKKVEKSSKEARRQSSLHSPTVGGSSGEGTSHAPKTAHGGNKPKKAASQHNAGAPIGSANVGAGGKTYPCNFCDQIYQSARSLYNHRKGHKVDLSCPFCKKKLSTQSNYNKHIKLRHTKTGAEKKQIDQPE